MSVWRLLYSETVDGELLGELPFIGLGFAEELNGVGRWSATIPADVYQGIGPGTNVVYMERDGVILGTGILWAVDHDYAAGTMTVTGEGIGSYYRKRRITIDFTYTATEQVEIVDSLLSITEALGGGVGATVVAEPTGVTRDRTYVGREVKPVLEAIEEVALVEGGFDLRWRARRNAGVIERVLYCDYPTTGRVTDHVFEIGVNCAILSYSEDAAGMANWVAGLGAGEGDDKVWNALSNYILGQTTPRLDDSVSHVDVSDADVLDGHIERRLRRGGSPARRINLRMVPGTLPELGSFDVGDRMRVRAPLTWRDVDDQFRLVTIDYQIGDSEDISVQLVGAELFDEF